MALTPVDEAGPSRKVALAGVALELAAIQRVEHGHGIVSEPYHLGKAGKLLRAAKTATISGAGITALAGRTRAGSVVGGVLLAAGSLLTRMGIFEAGLASAKDPKYTVIPQRERLEARQGARTDDQHEARSVTR
jgi:hypothetical protein